MAKADLQEGASEIACNHDVDWDERSHTYGVCKRCGVTVLLCDDCGHPEDDCICWIDENDRENEEWAERVRGDG